MTMKPTRVEATIAGKKITLETGQVARQAGGAVIATLGETKCFAAVTAGKAREDIDFFPLVCDYREKTEAAGKIPGGFFKREGRPTTKEILTMRLIDRSIRPMFAEGFKAEVQVMTTVMQYDGENNPDVLAMIAAFTAIRIGGCPSRRPWARSGWPTSTANSSHSPPTLSAAVRAASISWSPATRTASAWSSPPPRSSPSRR